MTDAALQRLIDESEILRIRRLWAFSRDQGDWETVKTLFHPGAPGSISWFTGTAEGFVEASKKLFGQGRRPETSSRHAFGNHRITLHSARALLEIDVEVRARDWIDGHLFDFVFEGRFFDRFERRDGAWKIAQWTCLYDKDRIEPVVPGSVPQSFYDGVELEGPESATAWMRFRQKKVGRPSAPVIIGGSAAEKKLKADAKAWLEQAP